MIDICVALNEDLSIPIMGWDVGELIECNIVAKGWRVFTPTDVDLNQWRYHLGTGSGHCGCLQTKRDEAMSILGSRGKEIRFIRSTG